MDCALWSFQGRRRISLRFLVAFLGVVVPAVPTQTPGKSTWKSVEFAIVKFNDEAPKSWNLYHAERKGELLLRLWKRYLLIDMKEQEVYEVDPQTVKPAGENVEWALTDKSAEPIETLEWRTRDIGPMQRVAFRLGKRGHILELQIPLKANGQPAY